MLSAIRTIGELVIEKENIQFIDTMIKNPNSSGNFNKVAAIIFECKNGEFSFNGVKLEDFKKENLQRYLFREGPKNGADITPVARFSRPSASKMGEKTSTVVDKKITGWFKILQNPKIDITAQERKFLEKLQDEVQKSAEKIKEEIIALMKKMSSKENLIIALKIKEGETEKYPGDYDVFRKLFMQQVEEKRSRIKVNEKVCSLCGRRKPVIFGGTNTYTFYTTDKPGYIAGGFKKENSWKNFPVCADCQMSLEQGRKYVEANLAFSFCGLKYYLIPKTIMEEKEALDEVLGILKEGTKKFSMKETAINRITGDEDDILWAVEDMKDSILFNFLFLKPENSAERILLLIEDVLPSRIRRLFEAKERVDEIWGGTFTFGTVRSFFSRSDSRKKQTDLDKYFMEVVNRIFKGLPVDYGFVLYFIMKRVRDAFVNSGEFAFPVFDGLRFLNFLSELKLIEMEETAMEERMFDSFFEKYGSVFKTPAKRGLFLLGALTQLLLREQEEQGKSKPFFKNLKGLKMTEKDFRGLLPKVQNKLEEYEKFEGKKRDIAREAASYLLKAGEGWGMSIDEMNFYFAAGMNLVWELIKKTE